MKKLVVCGDSYMSSVLYNPNDLDNGYNNHFTELLADDIGWEVINYARCACSNQTIRLQIEESIKLNPDCVIIGLTSCDRIELPINDLSVFKNYDPFRYFDKYKEKIKGYNPNNLLANIEYSGRFDKSKENDIFKNQNPVLISEVLKNLLEYNYPNKIFTSDDISIISNWFNRFYDHMWKMQQDYWIIQSGLYKLKELNINFYCINSTLYNFEFDAFVNNIIGLKSDLNPWKYTNLSVKYSFHTTLESQKILAKLWYNEFKNKKII